MDSTIEIDPTPVPEQSTSDSHNFLIKIRELLSLEGSHLSWHSDGKRFSFNRHHLEEYLKSDASQFDQPSVETFIGQLKQQGFVATATESIDNDDDDTFLAFQNPQFTRETHPDPPTSPPPRPQKPSKPFYCSAERNYLSYKRAHDPCYKLMDAHPRNPFDMAKERFRAVLAQQKLKRIISARLMAQPIAGGDVFRDLLPNETNISIQMGAIAGYYGETVIEEDLIRYFGKFLPMYKPISDVVDSITPSISNKIQASSFIWRNQTAAYDPLQQPTTIVTATQTTANKRGSIMKEVKAPAALVSVPDPCNDITFEYVSFKDQMQPPPLPPLTCQSKAAEEEQRNNCHAEMSLESGIVPTAGMVGLVNVVGQGITRGPGEPVIISHQQRDEFLPISGDCCDATDQMHGGDSSSVYSGNMQQFTTNLLDSNYYDTSSSHHDFGMELKNAIDLIMN